MATMRNDLTLVLCVGCRRGYPVREMWPVRDGWLCRECQGKRHDDAA